MAQKYNFNYDKANLIHNGKYDYSKVEYKNTDTKVIITCPIHGDFEQTPYKHINREQGCPKCKGSRISSTKSMSNEEFIEKARNIHGDKYDYSKVNYKNAHIHVNIICPKHGVFSQTPNNHLYIQNGCPCCGKNTSKVADDWLDSLNVPKENREKHLSLNNKVYKVDGYIPETNTVYEYFGNFWHGNPEKYNPNDINPKNGQTFGKLYNDTIERLKDLEQAGFNVVYTWGY